MVIFLLLKKVSYLPDVPTGSQSWLNEIAFSISALYETNTVYLSL